MAAFKLSYGDRKLFFKWPSSLVKGFLEGKDMPQTSSEGELVQEALKHPVDSLLLEELVSKGEKACIIVGDMTRLWVRHHILMEPLLDSLNAGGIADRDIFVISGTGDHRSQTAGEHRLLVGDNVYRRIKVSDHNSRGEGDLLLLGKIAAEVAAAAGIVSVNTLEEAVDFIRRKHGVLPPAYIIPHGNTTFPRLVQR